MFHQPRRPEDSTMGDTVSTRAGDHLSPWYRMHKTPLTNVTCHCQCIISTGILQLLPLSAIYSCPIILDTPPNTWETPCLRAGRRKISGLGDWGVHPRHQGVCLLRISRSILARHTQDLRENGLVITGDYHPKRSDAPINA